MAEHTYSTPASAPHPDISASETSASPTSDPAAADYVRERARAWEYAHTNDSLLQDTSGLFRAGDTLLATPPVEPVTDKELCAAAEGQNGGIDALFNALAALHLGLEALVARDNGGSV